MWIIDKNRKIPKFNEYELVLYEGNKLLGRRKYSTVTKVKRAKNIYKSISKDIELTRIELWGVNSHNMEYYTADKYGKRVKTGSEFTESRELLKEWYM